MTIQVCHVPPGSSKWNKIERRMFCHITQNWRGRPVLSREVVAEEVEAHPVPPAGRSERPRRLRMLPRGLAGALLADMSKVAAAVTAAIREDAPMAVALSFRSRRIGIAPFTRQVACMSVQRDRCPHPFLSLRDGIAAPTT